MRVDSAGDAYLAGATQSSDFPTTANALQRTYKGACNPVGNDDAYLTKFAPSGTSLLYSTYYGGCLGTQGYGLASDDAGHAYLTGPTTTRDLPTKNAYQATFGGGGQDAYVAKFDTTRSGGASLVYGTYLGGSGSDTARGIAVDAAGDAYVTGDTSSANFPTTAGTFQPAYGSGDIAFVTKLAPTGAALVYSTYVGRSGTVAGAGIALDAAGDAYVVGSITATNGITTAGALQPSYGGYQDAVVFRLSPAGDALVYSTYLGGSDYDIGGGIAVDGRGTAYVVGTTYSTDFPVQGAAQTGLAGYDAAFVTALAGDGSLAWSTYLGGGGANGANGANAVTLDAAGNVLVVGGTSAPDFPVTPDAYQGHNASQAGSYDIFLTRLASGGYTPGTVPWHPHQTVRLGAAATVSVDLADGHADVGTHDLAILGRGPALTLARTWDSAVARAGGSGLLASLTPRIGGTLTGNVVYTDTTGAPWDFAYLGAATDAGPYTAYRTPPGRPWRLTTATAGYTLTDDLSGEVWTFDGSGRLRAGADAYGNANTLSYGAGSASSPSALTNSGGRSLAFGYTNGLLSEAQSPPWQTGGAGQARSQRVTYGYNAAGQLTTDTRGAGMADARTTTFGYSGTRLTSVTTPYTGAVRTWGLGYDSRGRVASITSPASGTVGQAGYTPAYTTAMTYGLTQTTVVRGYGAAGALTTTYSLDAQGQSITVTDGLGQSSSASYGADHDVTSRTDANSATTGYQYQYVGPNGSVGLRTAVTAPAIAPYGPLTTTYSYNPATYDLVEVDTPRGGRTLYTDNAYHAVLTTAQLITTTPSAQWRGTLAGYDPYGEQTSTTEGRGVTVSAAGIVTPNNDAASYTRHSGDDPQGDGTSQSTPPLTTTLNGSTTTAPVTTTTGYDADGDRTSATAANGATTIYADDHLGRQVRTTLPPVPLYSGGTTTPVETTGYDGEGNVATTTDATGATTTSSYDPLGRQVSTTNPVAGTTRTTYNATEQVAQQDAAGNVTRSGYDGAGRLTQVSDALTGTVQYGYDAAGNTLTITTGDTTGDTTGAVISSEARVYDALNRVTSATTSGPGTGGTAQTTATTYDQDGHAIQTQAPNGTLTLTQYDLAGDAVETDEQANGVTTLYAKTSYDAAGNAVQSTDADGRTTTTTYDPDTRIAQTVATVGTSTVTTAYAYDPDGNTLSTTTTDGAGTHTQGATFDAEDRRTSVTDDGATTTYGYDAAGQQRTETLPGGATTLSMGVDAEGRITALTDTTSGVGTATSLFGYNPNDQPVTRTLPGGTGVHATTTYDANGRVTGVVANGPGGTAQTAQTTRARARRRGRPWRRRRATGST